MRCLVFLIGVFFSSVTKGQSLDSISLKYLQNCKEGKFEENMSFFDSTVTGDFSATDLEEVWNSFVKKNGAFVGAEIKCVEKKEKGALAFCRLEYENAKLVIKIVFNSSAKMVGFFIVGNNNCGENKYVPPAYDYPDKYSEKTVVLLSDSIRLPGIITIPAKWQNGSPAVIFVHGSGPSDMDETIGPNKLFRDMAVGLARNGIVSLRYEKRTLNNKLNENFTIRDEVLNDVYAAIEFLKKEMKPGSIFVLGHSLGAMLAPEIAAENKKVKGIVMLAGNARLFETLVLEQHTYLTWLDDTITKGEEEQLNELRSQVIYLRDSLKSSSPADKLMFNIPASYWLSLKEYHQAEVLKELKNPVLILQGKRDYQVTMKDFELWQDAAKEKPNVSFKSYEKLNHLFLEGTGKSTPEEYEFQQSIPWYVINDISKWIEKQK